MVEAPCANRSERLTQIYGNVVYVGLVHIQGLEEKTIETLLTLRQQDGLYEGLYNCIERTGIAPEQINLLIRVGAFRFTGKSKKGTAMGG